MKQFKSTMLIAIGGLVMATAAITSCSKKDDSSTAPTPSISSISPNPVTAGQSITITGTNFASGATVTIGGASATVSAVTATSITATVPASVTAGSKAVVVTVNGKASTGFALTVNGASTGPTSDSVANDNLIAHWTFDNTTIEDISGKSPVAANSSASSSYTFATGRIGQAISFTNGWLTYPVTATPASADNTTFGSNDTLQNGYTVSLWIKVPVSPVDGSNSALLGSLFQLNTSNLDNWGNLGIAYRKAADSTFDFDGSFFNVDGDGPHLSYGSLFYEGSLKDDQNDGWAFLTMTYDTTGGKNLKYYFNGALVKTQDVSSYFTQNADETLLVPTPNYATIGSFAGVDQNNSAILHTPVLATTIPSFMANDLTGIVDDVRLFNKTLSDQDITNLYNYGLAGK